MTTRSYLFAPDDAASATTRLIATAARLTGFLKGAPGGYQPGWYLSGADNGAMLATLYNTIRLTYPAAGPGLWAVRMWTNLLWQPAYLAVIGVHVHGAVPSLAGLVQSARGIYVDGYRLPNAPQWSGTVDEMIEHAARDLRQVCDIMLDEINALVRLKPLPARRLFADRMLSLMVRLAHWRPDLPPSAIRAFSDAWLHALGLTGQGDLETVFLPDGREALIVARKGCCLDYRIDPGAYCATCPKQDNAVRVARQTANLIAELG